MRTTIDLPDSLLRQAKARAALEGLTLKELIASYVVQGLQQGDVQRVAQPRRRSAPPMIARAATGKPILTATELAVSDPTNAGPATVKATGRVCYASANRAVTALEHLTRYARFRGV